MNKIFFLALILLSSQISAQDYASEVENTAIIADRYNYASEVTLIDGSRCDLITKTHAIEVEWVDKWKEAPGQAILYSILTGKKPGVILLYKNKAKEKHHILRCKMVCDRLGIDMVVVKAL